MPFSDIVVGAKVGAILIWTCFFV